jgi:hypothetical protein
MGRGKSCSQQSVCISGVLIKSRVVGCKDFDAVVVASGRFSVPNIPNIPGLAEWQDRFSGHIIHGREYRLPGPYSGQNVLVVGAGVCITTRVLIDLFAHLPPRWTLADGKRDLARHQPRRFYKPPFDQGTCSPPQSRSRAHHSVITSARE